MRGLVNTLHCDVFNGGEDCTEWSVDYYAETASEVGGVRITQSTRAPGWTSTTDGRDFCPKHRDQAEQVQP